MVVLFAFVGGTRHGEPLVPLARAARTAGHTVAFVCGPSMAAPVRQAGFRAFATGPEAGGLLTMSPQLELDAEREDRVLRESFGRRLARARARDLVELCADWRPDLVVCDEVDFGAVVAAERLELPLSLNQRPP